MSNSIYVHNLAAEQFSTTGLETGTYDFEFDAIMVENPASIGSIKISRIANIGFVTIKWPALFTGNSNSPTPIVSVITTEFGEISTKFMPAAGSQVLGNVIVNIDATAQYAQLLLIKGATANTLQLQLLLESGASIETPETFVVGTIGGGAVAAISNFTYSLDVMDDVDLNIES